jgi:hypothetical protein
MNFGRNTISPLQPRKASKKYGSSSNGISSASFFDTTEAIVFCSHHFLSNFSSPACPSMGRYTPLKSPQFKMQSTNWAKEKFKKAPMAPQRFKYVFFPIEKQKEIRGNTEKKVRNDHPIESLGM